MVISTILGYVGSLKIGSYFLKKKYIKVKSILWIFNYFLVQNLHTLDQGCQNEPATGAITRSKKKWTIKKLVK